MVSRKQMEPLTRSLCRTKNQQKWIKGKKVMGPQSKGARFFKKILDRTAHNLSWNPSENP